ncbi:MAG: sulfotransferase, partial [Rhizobiales bacterium]|nr:sulfotransferase [Hyphomicrobiales bacterium]
ETAARIAGHDDLGDWAYAEGFDILLCSLETEANLNAIGRWGLRRSILYALITRLLLVEHRRHNKPVPIEPPIIITGLPRTGTTFLHRLLAQDEQFHAPPLWHLMQPFPRHRFDSLALRRARFKLMLAASLPFLSDIDARHYIRADEPEECMFAMAQSFCSMLFWTQAPVYDYLDWYRQADRAAKYSEYGALLPILDMPGKRLLLKAPEHLGSIDHASSMVRGTVIVQTHRDPITAFASFASLMRGTHAMVTDAPDHKRAARATLQWLAEETRRNAGVRRSMNNVIDIAYDDIVSNPLAAAERIYRFAKLDLAPETRSRFQTFIAQNPQGKRGVHRYSAEETGIAEAEIRQAFEALPLTPS